MQRHSFLLLASILPGIFGGVMMIAPHVMLGNSVAIATDPSTAIVTQWVGFGTFSLAVINFLARKDPGSVALRAVMVGNIVFHVLGIAFDIYDFTIGFMTMSGLLTGLVSHSFLAGGFTYYLLQFDKSKPTPAAP